MVGREFAGEFIIGKFASEVKWRLRLDSVIIISVFLYNFKICI